MTFSKSLGVTQSSGSLELTPFDLLIKETWLGAGRPQRLLMPAEAAEYLGLSLSTLYRGIDERTLPLVPVRPASAPRFPWLLIARYAAIGGVE